MSPNLPGRFETHDETIARLRRDGLDKAAPDLVASWFMAGKDDPHYEDTMALAHMSSVDAACRVIRAMQGWDATDRIGRVTVTTLAISGDRERNVIPEVTHELWRALPNGRLCILPDCAHAAHMERAGLFNTIVGEFLSAGQN